MNHNSRYKEAWGPKPSSGDPNSSNNQKNVTTITLSAI